MSHALKSLPVVACAMMLAGCANPFGQEGYFRDKSGDYTQARVTEPLEVPEHINPVPMGDILAIREISQDHDSLPAGFEVPRPDQRLSQNTGSVFSIERDGNRQWVLASKNPSEVWSRILIFLEENEVPVAAKNAKKGFLETEWVDLGQDRQRGFMYRTLGKLVGAEDATPIEDRFRLTIQQGVRPGSAEIYLQHKGRPLTGEGAQPAPEPEEWDNLERSQRLNNEVLNELLLFLVRDEDEKSVSYLAQDLDLGSLVSMDRDGNGNPLLRIDQLSYARSWAAIGDALAKAGVEVSDRNRSAGIFYIQIDPAGEVAGPEEKPGFFSRMFGSKDKEEAPKDVVHMRVSELNGVVRVAVEKDANTSAPAEVSQKLLNLVKDNLK
ncbi:MAG: outer membrane protein assembly factor BamC [Endozoicomonas sp.]